MEQKFVRGNQMPFMKTDLSKKIIKMSRRRNRFLKDKSLENGMLYTDQRNCWVSLLRKTKIRYSGLGGLFLMGVMGVGKGGGAKI